MIKAICLALVVYFLVRGLLPDRISSKGAIYVGVASFAAVVGFEALGLNTRRETFADTTNQTTQTADEAGLVFGDLTGGINQSNSNAVYYSGMTVSLQNEANMYAGKSAASQPFVTMNDVTSTASVLSNFRIIGLDVKSFDKLTPLMYTELFCILHNDTHQDRYVCSQNGKLTYGNVKPVGADTSHVFKFVNPANQDDNTGAVTLVTPVLLQFAGASAGSASFVYVDTDGTLNCNGTVDKATSFRLGDCLAACTGPTWRFV